MLNSEFMGFAYRVRNANGREFLLSASFAPTKTQAKHRLKSIQFQRCNQHRPLFEVVALLEVEIRVLSQEAA
jgi:hypothetical protein